MKVLKPIVRPVNWGQFVITTDDEEEDLKQHLPICILLRIGQFLIRRDSTKEHELS